MAEMDFTLSSDEEEKRFKEFLIQEQGSAAINALAEKIHNMAKSKGFWTDTEEAPHLSAIPTKLALIHSEVSEALEVHRKGGKRSKFTEELADIIIRTLDLAQAIDLDIGTAIIEKMEANESRPHKHGRRY